MKLIALFVTAASAVCLTRKQCLASALHEFKRIRRNSACAIVKSEFVQPRGEWSVTTIRRGVFHFRIYCADRETCAGCTIDLDSDNLYSVHGYDASALAKRGNVLSVIPLADYP